MNNESQLPRLVPLSRYQEERRDIFQTPISLRWFVEHNREALVAAGALVRPCRSLLAIPELFDQVVEDVGRKRASASRKSRAA